MPPVVLHGFDVFEAAVDLADVGLDLVASVGPQDDEGRSHPPVPHPGDGSPPHLETQTMNIKPPLQCFVFCFVVSFVGLVRMKSEIC